MFKIGHPAYTGSNAPALAASKSKAVELLRARGMKRDVARAAIDYAILDGGYATEWANGVPVEINVTEHLVDGRKKTLLERQILNRNANLALDLFHQHKQHHGYAPYHDTLVRNLLLVKRGIYLPPPPREVILNPAKGA